MLSVCRRKLPGGGNSRAVRRVSSLPAEPSLASLGLGGWSPPGMVQSCLEYLHVSHALPWWGAIAVGTVCVRLLIFPLVVKTRRDVAHMNNNMPAMMHLQSRFAEARKSGDAVEARKRAAELIQFTKDKKVNPLKNAVGPLAQMPFFVSFFFGLREMAALPVESLKTGGALWFPDLTVADPYFGLPLITSATLLAVVETGAETGKAPTPGLRVAFRLVPLVMFPFVAQFPAAILCYWACTNAITLAQVAALRIPSVRERLGIPDAVRHPEPPGVPGRPASLRDAWADVKKSWEVEERRLLERRKAEAERGRRE